MPCTDRTITALQYYNGDRIAKADKKTRYGFEATS